MKDFSRLLDASKNLKRAQEVSDLLDHAKVPDEEVEVILILATAGRAGDDPKQALAMAVRIAKALEDVRKGR